MKHVFPPSEEFLQYLWHRLYFSQQGLRSTSGHDIVVLRPGIWNRDQGPDFLDACIRLDGVDLYGHVEIHLHSQDWYRHEHHLDPYFNGTILHVVFDSQSLPILREDGSELPELMLKPHVDEALWQKYDRLRLSEKQIPCEFYLDRVSFEDKKALVKDLGRERFEEKVYHFRLSVGKEQQYFLKILWQSLAGSLGGVVNKESFKAMAEQIDMELIKPYLHQPLRLEALLFGGAGLLEGKKHDDYQAQLSREWEFLKRKHRLNPFPPGPIKFLRMHPASFPTIRLSQMAHLLHAYPRLEDLLNPDNWQSFLKKRIHCSSYWESHNRFGIKSKKKQVKNLGKSLKRVLILNVLAPLGYLYLKGHGREGAMENMLSRLSAFKPEDNRYTRRWEGIGFSNENMVESQGVLKLAKDYCLEKRCLSCRIGQRILGP